MSLFENSVGPNFFVKAQQCKWTLLKVIVTKDTEIIYGKQFVVFVFSLIPSRYVDVKQNSEFGFL